MGIPLFPSKDNKTSSKPEEFVSTCQVEKLFKERYDAEHRRKENLDKKSNNLLVGITTTVTIYGGVGVLSETNFFTNSSITDNTVIPLLVGLSALIIGIILSIISLSLRDYWTVVNLDDFGVVNNEKFEVNLKNVDNLRKTEPVLFSAMTINSYIEFSIRNKKINDRKADWIISSQILFIIGIGSIPIYLLVL